MGRRLAGLVASRNGVCYCSRGEFCDATNEEDRDAGGAGGGGSKNWCGGRAADAVQPGGVSARGERDRPRVVRLGHALTAVPRLQRHVALLATNADADLRDLRVRRAREPL